MSAGAAADARLAPSERLLRTGALAVLRAAQAREYAPVVEALIEGGLESIELTLTTTGVVEELPRLRARFGESAEFGVGTVTTAAEATSAIAAGADYLVTPTTLPDVIAVAVASRTPVYPGGLTPSELHRGWSEGATAVKLFPASTVGPSYLDQLRGPFPHLPVVPSGGVGLEDAAAWVRAGAVAVSVGGPLVRDAFDAGSLRALTERAVRLRATIDETRS